MPRIFLGNFEFEHELAGAGGASFQRTAPGNRQLLKSTRENDRSWVWTAVAEAGDFVITGGDIDAADFGSLAQLGLPVPRFCSSIDELPRGEQWQLVPWGWTESLEQIGRANGWICQAPPADVVRRVNSREFRFGIECDWNIAIARSIAELEKVIADSPNHPRGWLLKANYGMAGREAMRGRGARLEGTLRNWAERRLATSGPIVFEPIVDRVAEAGIQIEIPCAGAPELVGVTPLLVDGSGVYRGSRFGCPAAEIACWQPAVQVGLRAATELQRLGYFGPLGIDTMQYRDDGGQIRLRPLQDLNARLTMGRLALGFGRVLTKCGSWLHFDDRHLGGCELSQWLDTVQSELPAGAIAVPASPQSAGSVTSRAVLVVAPSPTIRNSAEAVVFRALGISAAG
jgi:hypothetical protein